MRRFVSCSVAAALFQSLALMAGAVPATAATSVTVYSHDLGFVREDRVLESTRGDTVLIDVPARIDFSSTRLVPRSGRVARMAYRFDVGSGDEALERARGSRVRAVLRGERVVEGTLVATDGAWLLIRGDDGTLHTAARTAVEDVSFSARGRSLVLEPSLEVVLDGSGNRTEAELSYLTGGLSWNAEHVVVRRGEGTGTWSSGVTVSNTTGRDFVNATLKLVAGDPGRAGPSPMPMPKEMRMMATASEGAADLSEQTFSEYHLYALDRPATLRDREAQSLSMYERRDIKFRTRYRTMNGSPIRAQLDVANHDANGLGMPLPGGRVRFYEADASGALQFAGETVMRHTAERETLSLDVGAAFDLVAERREVSNRRISDREREATIEIKLRNQKKTNVEIMVEESAGGETEVTQQSHPFRRRDANTIEFAIPVAAGKEVTVRYTIRMRW